jgi:hypothetical protein
MAEHEDPSATSNDGEASAFDSTQSAVAWKKRKGGGASYKADPCTKTASYKADPRMKDKVLFVLAMDAINPYRNF